MQENEKRVRPEEILRAGKRISNVISETLKGKPKEVIKQRKEAFADLISMAGGNVSRPNLNFLEELSEEEKLELRTQIETFLAPYVQDREGETTEKRLVTALTWPNMSVTKLRKELSFLGKLLDKLPLPQAEIEDPLHQLSVSYLETTLSQLLIDIHDQIINAPHQEANNAFAALQNQLAKIRLLIETYGTQLSSDQKKNLETDINNYLIKLGNINTGETWRDLRVVQAAQDSDENDSTEQDNNETIEDLQKAYESQSLQLTLTKLKLMIAEMLE